MQIKITAIIKKHDEGRKTMENIREEIWRKKMEDLNF
jgi:hypothetical protein